MDFVLARRNRPPVAIECKWSADQFEPNGIKAFRAHYRKGANFVVAADVDRAFTKRFGRVSVNFVSLKGLIVALAPKERTETSRRV